MSFKMLRTRLAEGLRDPHMRDLLSPRGDQGDVAGALEGDRAGGPPAEHRDEAGQALQVDDALAARAREQGYRFISFGTTGVSACTCSLIRSSMRPISRSFTWVPCEKSKRR